ncbi:MAG: hypothetical protein PHR26_02975 [Candidatus ainarchaeum sp.]|nr:hypothetical protein [Candidatus ainarchaeum sp.]MDD3975566.1 hypothetical protein [Candidatus ainarchaeum sp.]
MYPNIFLATSFQDVLWLLLLIVFSMSIYVWSKGKIANKTAAIIITLIIVYLIFIRFQELVWIVAIGVVVFWIYGADIKKAIKIKI